MQGWSSSRSEATVTRNERGNYAVRVEFECPGLDESARRVAIVRALCAVGRAVTEVSGLTEEEVQAEIKALDSLNHHVTFTEKETSK